MFKGIRFGYNQNSLDQLKPLELQIQGTLYDVEKNELITFLDGKPTSMWITPNVMSSSVPDYQRIRYIICYMIQKLSLNLYV